MKVTLISNTEKPFQIIEKAASMCYKSKPSLKVIEACYKSGHHSIFEHASFTFLIEGVSRALLAQLTRQRIASFSVVSQRYCSMENAEMITPPISNKVKDQETALAIFEEAYGNALEAYSALQELGLPNEDARFVLPNGCYVDLVMTVNLRSFMHICNERLCSRAQWEIQEMVKQMVIATLKLECLDENEKDFLGKILVPKCMAGQIWYCTEGKNTCGLCPLPEKYILKGSKNE